MILKVIETKAILCQIMILEAKRILSPLQIYEILLV